MRKKQTTTIKRAKANTIGAQAHTFSVGDYVATTSRDGGDLGGRVAGVFGPLIVFVLPGGAFDARDAAELFLVASAAR